MDPNAITLSRLAALRLNGFGAARSVLGYIAVCRLALRAALSLREGSSLGSSLMAEPTMGSGESVMANTLDVDAGYLVKRGILICGCTTSAAATICGIK